ncbi:MAG: DUF6788 family protein [Pseudonocardiaceae bacterium]
MAEPNAAERRAQAAIARSLGDAGFALPGTLIERTMACGKANCRCKADPPRLHGPYHQWTRKIDRKTVTVNLTDDQLARYGPWFANARTLRTALNDLEELSLRIAKRAEGWR